MPARPTKSELRERLRAVRRALPEARLTLVGLPWAAELASRLDAVDDFIALPGYPGLPELACDANDAAEAEATEASDAATPCSGPYTALEAAPRNSE